MRELLKTFFGFSWSLSLLGVKAVSGVFRGRTEETSHAFDAVAEAARDQLDPQLRAAYDAGDGLQRRILDESTDRFQTEVARHRWGRLDASVFVVLGEGLAAGAGPFGVHAGSQQHGFPAQMAAQLCTPFEQPLLEPPGLGPLPGLSPGRGHGREAVPVLVPDLLQTTVRTDFPGDRSRQGNFAVPGLHLAHALRAQPRAPLVHRHDSLQTALNLMVGLPDLTTDPLPAVTPLEAARGRRPTFAVVALGFSEIFEAAVNPDQELPDPGAFGTGLHQILAALRETAEVVVATVPDPLATAYFSSLTDAAEILRTESTFLSTELGLAADDSLTLPGLLAAGYNFMARRPGDPLPEGSVLAAGRAREITARLSALNDAVHREASQAGALVLDLHDLYRRLAREGLSAGDRRLSGRYLGGFFNLGGVYPGATGQALIANEALALLNRTFGASLPAIDIAGIARQDPALELRPAPGPRRTEAYRQPLTQSDLPPLPPLDPPPTIYPIQTTYPNLQPGKGNCVPAKGIPAGGLPDPAAENPEKLPLKLPPGLEQTLDLQPAASYLADALRIVDCPGEKPIIPGFPPFGICGNFYFGGPLATVSHLSGKVHVRFSPPDENCVSRFEVRHPGGLRGEDSDLAAPLLWRMPVQHTTLDDVPELVSSGELHLDTGRVTNLHYNLRNANTALFTLFGVNPGLPPVALTFPGPPNAGSSSARFEQRPDGLLDFTFDGNLFLPLGVEAGGEPIRCPLPFSNPQLQCASFPARGMSLHPQLHLTTRAPEGGGAPLKVETNRVLELAPFVHNTSFGDAFDLAVPELGGPATGRSHLMGRVRLQLGPRTSRGTARLLVQVLPPGGLLDEAPLNPPFLPAGVSRGMIGFNEILHFKKQTYPQHDLANADDPFNLSGGVVDLETGEILGGLLLRGYVIQELYGQLLHVEPCTPADSFNYRGPARLEQEASGDLVLRFNGGVYLPYPEGFRFPSTEPGGIPPFVVRGPSRLDPFRRIQAMTPAAQDGPFEAQRERLVSSTGEEFSYRLSIAAGAADSGQVLFEYENHSEKAHFVLRSLSWLALSRSRGATGAPDTATLTGFGVWSRAPRETHQIAVHVSTAPHAPYVGILVDGGNLSNVNTKPEDIASTIP